ncbi:caspase family protein [Plebeiibacterium marinum]|uniref:Caspase family protein n=1 Tax=Plebeiibacterium marinum TaxID=2992111 RepID=A0AAE3SL03_9BACT|nr:caspase family protein [Plebeiobacterium marinum]MCW3807410.1 caspase family protein [Plebeiobacterium marinum]
MEERRNVIFTIGIDKYETAVWRDLKNAVLDSKSLVKMLTTKYNFEEFPHSLYDFEATKENIYQSFNTLKNSVCSDDNIIIFFAGHGNMNPITKRGYWIPHEGTADIHTWIENSVIKDFIADIEAKHIWLVADSCFSGTFLINTREIFQEKSYTVLDRNISRWMLASGSEEKVSDGSAGKHSPFCNYLLRVLEQNTNVYLSVLEVINYVQVLTQNNSNQTPIGAFIDNIGHLGGEMILQLDKEYVTQNIDISQGKPNTPSLRLELSKYENKKRKVSAGKEILFIESFVDNADFLIVENFRFDDEGNKKLKFKDDKVILGAEGKDSFTLVQRFASWAGIERYLEENNEQYCAKKIVIINAHKDIETVENSQYALAQADFIHELINFNKDLMSCLHCGGRISTNDSCLVEIDEIGLKNNVGNVHRECLRPADRILGKSGYEDLIDSYLVNFDYKLWHSLLEKGHGQLGSSVTQINGNKRAIISWNPENNKNDGSYCIRVIYENGSIDFVTLGKEIHRFPKNKIDEELSFFNRELEKAKISGDPQCKIVETKISGNFKLLSKLKETDQTLTEVKAYEKAFYSNQFEQNTLSIENDYTPIGLIKDFDSEELVMIGDVVPFISKPENFDSFIANWKEVIPEINKCTIKIIKSDFELDTYLQSFFKKGLQPIIDPLFDSETKKIDSGLIFKRFQDIIEQAKLKKQKSWKQGDKVEVVFPGVQSNKQAKGILLTDEFIDEVGELCVIFNPIEDGKILDGMQFKLPVKLLINWDMAITENQRRSIFSILIKKGDLGVTHLGTGFFIGPEGLFFTCGHTFRKIDDEIKSNGFKNIFIGFPEGNSPLYRINQLYYRSLEMYKQKGPEYLDVAVGVSDFKNTDYLVFNRLKPTCGTELKSVGIFNKKPSKIHDVKGGIANLEMLELSETPLFVSSQEPLISDVKRDFEIPLSEVSRSKFYNNCVDMDGILNKGESGCPIIDSKGMVRGTFIASSKHNQKSVMVLAKYCTKTVNYKTSFDFNMYQDLEIR